MKIDPDPRDRPVELICLPTYHARDLRECHRLIPTPGDRGTCRDRERAGVFLPTDCVLVAFDGGTAAGELLWLPAYCFRLLEDAP